MPDETLDKLGEYFTYHRFLERYGITFEQFVHKHQIGTWKEVVA